LASGIDARFDLVEHRLGIQTTCNIDNQILIHSPVEESLFHIILEALNNSLKHSQATEVSVNLQEENLILCLEVIDNGAGFRYQPGFEISGYAGLGLRNMKTRAKELGGELEIDTAPGSGTRIHLKIAREPEPNQRSGK
jgi:NarL family two-component system sensor histidine kinase LiaS